MRMSSVRIGVSAPFFGGVPEWSKGTDCKSVGNAFGGSNPPPTTTNSKSYVGGLIKFESLNYMTTCIILANEEGMYYYLLS